MGSELMEGCKSRVLSYVSGIIYIFSNSILQNFIFLKNSCKHHNLIYTIGHFIGEQKKSLHFVHLLINICSKNMLYYLSNFKITDESVHVVL